MTLIEMAIVLVVLGLLLSLGTSMMTSMVKRVQFTNSREIVYGAVDSLTSFAATNGRLPASLSEFQSSVQNPNDAWNKPLAYIAGTGLGGTANTICGRRTTDFTVCRDANCTSATNIPNVAFLIASGGDNLNMQTFSTGPAGGCTSKQCVRVYSPLTPDVYSVIYDDIAKWVNMDELRTKAGCEGAPLSIVNNELPYGKVNQTYSATIYPSGGVPLSGNNYNWCVEGTLVTGAASGVYLCTGNSQVTISPAGTCSSLQESSTNPWFSGPNLFFGNAACTTSSQSPMNGAQLLPGTYSLTVYARDDNNPGNNDPGCSSPTNQDNCANKMFVLTINPQ